MLTTSDPLLLRCLALTGSFETGHPAPACFSSLTGDFDGQGLSFSCLQWNIGQVTLQPLLLKMHASQGTVMAACFGVGLASQLRSVMLGTRLGHLAWARSIQDHNGAIQEEWAKSFTALGATREWQEIAMESAGDYFVRAKALASTFGLESDRAIALLFDCEVQNGGLSQLATHHALDSFQAGWGEEEKMRCIAGAVADSARPKFRQDVLERKLTIANGAGKVHRFPYDLAQRFAL